MPDDTLPTAPARPSPRFGMAVVMRWRLLPGNIRGAVYLILGTLLLTLMAVMFKVLGQELPPFEILFFRFLAGLIVLIPMFARRGFATLRSEKHWLHFARGLSGTIGNGCAVFAIIHMALADATTIQFSRPLFMLVIAAMFLGEAVGWQRRLVAILGFTGIMIITRPFGDGFEPWALVAALGALAGTMVVLTVKLLSRTEPTMVVMFYFALWTTVLSFVPMLFVWQTPTLEQLALLALTGILGLVGQSWFTHGLRLGETTFVLPFDYLRIVYAAILGIILFGEIPDFWSFLGAGIIIGTSLYLVLTENQKHRASRRARKTKPE